MTTPEQWLERLEAAERSSTGPPAGSGDRVWAAIEGRLDNGPAPPELDQAPLLEQAGEVAVGAASGSSGVGLKLVVAAVLIGLVGGGLALALRDRTEPVAERVAAIEPSPVEPTPALEPIVEPVEPEPAVVEPVLVEPALVEPVVEPEPEKPKPKSKPITPEPTAPKTLADEVALMQALSTALKAGDSQEVLVLVAQHEREFESGQFIEERRAAKARALCQSGKLAAGQKQAASFAARWPKSIHLAAVEHDCKVE